MSASASRILIVDDDQSLRRVLELQLQEAGHQVAAVASGPEALERLEDGEPPDLVVADLRMPGMDGLALLGEIKRRDPEALVVMITAHGDIQTAVRALQEGAFDFLTKPISRETLLGTVTRALNFRRLYFKVARQREALQERYSFARIVGASPAMQRVFEHVRRAAPRQAAILIRGETGTGKELLARAIHHGSPRAAGPFVSLNCAAIPEHLMESAFFGHERGAFTGAQERHTGCYEEADGGTLFLDEIGLLDLQLQGKLLRLLETGTLRRVGGDRDLAFDVRLLAATSSPLEEMIAAGTFREDLYYRLRVVEIHLPPLRDRLEDLPLLVDHLLVELGAPRTRLQPAAMRALQAHAWPGNIRELRNVLERALILGSDEHELGQQDLGLDPAPGEDTSQDLPREDLADCIEVPRAGIDMQEVERRLLQLALRECGGNRTRAARFLGLGRHALLYRMRKHGLTTDEDEGEAGNGPPVPDPPPDVGGGDEPTGS